MFYVFFFCGHVKKSIKNQSKQALIEICEIFNLTTPVQKQNKKHTHTQLEWHFIFGVFEDFNVWATAYDLIKLIFSIQKIGKSP